MSEAGFVGYFRTMPKKFVRTCKLLVAARPGEQVVGFWGGKDTMIHSPNILAFDARLLANADTVSQWICLTGSRFDVVGNQRSNGTTIEGGQPLSCLDGKSYPNLEVEWDTIAPEGYSEWLTDANPEKREMVLNAIKEYDNFYRSNYPFEATNRDVFAIVGGWGFYIYEDEWTDHPESEPIAFTLADSEPFYSMRRIPNGQLVAKAIIT